jgi:hypothetical protein
VPENWKKLWKISEKTRVLFRIYNAEWKGKKMKFANFVAAGVLMMISGSAVADSLPVFTPTSIQINGKEYVPNMTLDSANVSYKITYSFPAMNALYKASMSVPTSTWYGLLCSDSTISCVTNSVEKKAVQPYGSLSGISLTGNATLLPGNNNLQIVVSAKSDQFFGSAATSEHAIATGGAITIQYVIPGKQTLTVNGNALASSDAIPASTNQSVSASVTVSSADNGMAGQVYVAAVLPKDPTIYLLTSAKKWAPWNGKAFSPCFVGALSAQSVDMGTFDLTAAKGAQLFVGYGVGTGDAADKDLLTGKYSSWPVK